MDKLVVEPYFDIIVYEESRSDLMSLPIVIGGNREIYEDIRALAFSVNSKLLEIYNDGLSVLKEHYQGDAPITRQKYEPLVDNKLTEIESLLKYADLRMFSRSLQEKQDKFQLHKLEMDDLNNIHKHELSILEPVFGEEITFLFYSNMSKENDNALLQFTPTHTLFLDSRRKDKLLAIASSRSILLSILHRDKDIRAWFSKRLKDSLIYHKNTQDEMCDFYKEVSGEKLDICTTAD